jgi:hypothetical protein
VHLVGFLFIFVIADARNHEPEINVILLCTVNQSSRFYLIVNFITAVYSYWPGKIGVSDSCVDENTTIGHRAARNIYRYHRFGLVPFFIFRAACSCNNHPNNADSDFYIYIAFISITQYKRHRNPEYEHLHGLGFITSVMI